MKFRDLKIGQKFRFTGPEKNNPPIRTKASSRTYTNQGKTGDGDARKPDGKLHKRTSRLNYAVAVVNESCRLLSFKEYLNENYGQLDELTNIPKWWYNTKTRRAIKITSDFHIQQVFSTPAEFGLTQDDLLRLAPKNFRLRDVIPAIAKPLRKKGWVEVTWLKKPNTAVFRAENNDFAQKTLNWYLKKINASPKSITVRRPEGTDFLKSDVKITAFAKTGRVIQQTEIGATMARFR